MDTRSSLFLVLTTALCFVLSLLISCAKRKNVVRHSPTHQNTSKKCNVTAGLMNDDHNLKSHKMAPVKAPEKKPTDAQIPATPGVSSGASSVAPQDDADLKSAPLANVKNALASEQKSNKESEEKTDLRSLPSEDDPKQKKKSREPVELKKATPVTQPAATVEKTQVLVSVNKVESKVTSVPETAKIDASKTPTMPVSSNGNAKTAMPEKPMEGMEQQTQIQMLDKSICTIPGVNDKNPTSTFVGTNKASTQTQEKSTKAKTGISKRNSTKLKLEEQKQIEELVRTQSEKEALGSLVGNVKVSNSPDIAAPTQAPLPPTIHEDVLPVSKYV